MTELKVHASGYMIEPMVHDDKLRDEFAHRLAQACKDFGLEEHGRGVKLAKAIGVTPKAVSKWLAGESRPRPEAMEALARYLKADLAWLQLGMPKNNKDEPKNFSYEGKHQPGKAYPLISWVNAGAWMEAYEPYTLDEIDEWYESDAHTQGNAFWLKVQGDSMTSPVGVSIPEGMLILVDTGREPKNGSLVVAKLVDANEATFKKYVVDEGFGQKYLQPLNPMQHRVPINGNCKIIGVAIETRMKLI